MYINSSSKSSRWNSGAKIIFLEATLNNNRYFCPTCLKVSLIHTVYRTKSIYGSQRALKVYFFGSKRALKDYYFGSKRALKDYFSGSKQALKDYFIGSKRALKDYFLGSKHAL